MKELDSFTVEEIEEIISSCQQEIHNTPTSDEFPVSPRLLLSLARIALAAKRAEPWGYEVSGKLFNSIFAAGNYASEMRCDTLALYTTPQLNSPEIPDGWIKCSDRRPERGTDVQVYCSDTREQFVAFHIGNGEFQYAQHEDTSIACRPSHWMPLSAAPEKPL